MTRSDQYSDQAVVTHVLLTDSIPNSAKKLTHNHSDARYSQILKAAAVDLDLSQTDSGCRLSQTDSGHVVAICTRHGCRHVLVFYLPFSLSFLLKVI